MAKTRLPTKEDGGCPGVGTSSGTLAVAPAGSWPFDQAWEGALGCTHIHYSI